MVAPTVLPTAIPVGPVMIRASTKLSLAGCAAAESAPKASRAAHHRPALTSRASRLAPFLRRFFIIAISDYAALPAWPHLARPLQSQSGSSSLLSRHIGPGVDPQPVHATAAV